MEKTFTAAASVAYARYRLEYKKALIAARVRKSKFLTANVASMIVIYIIFNTQVYLGLDTGWYYSPEFSLHLDSRVITGRRMTHLYSRTAKFSQ